MCNNLTPNGRFIFGAMRSTVVIENLSSGSTADITDRTVWLKAVQRSYSFPHLCVALPNTSYLAVSFFSFLF